MSTIWFLVPLPFLSTACTSGSSQFMYCWRLAWRILSITLLACETRHNRTVVWTFFGIALLWDWNEHWSFPVLWPLLSLPDCWHIECSSLSASSFTIWISSAGISSPSLVLFLVVLPETHLTLYLYLTHFCTPHGAWKCPALTGWSFKVSQIKLSHFLLKMMMTQDQENKLKYLLSWMFCWKASLWISRD